MWQIPNPPSANHRQWIEEVHDKIGPDSGVVARIEFFPGSAKDADFLANSFGGAAYPWEDVPLIVINANTNAHSKQAVQGTLGHELGHCVDWRDTHWSWHHWENEGLDALSIQMKDKFAEFFASGYAIRWQFMDAMEDWRKPLKEFAAELRASLAVHLSDGLPISDVPAAGFACGSMAAVRQAMTQPSPGRRIPRRPPSR
jgi:hypothetical protein